jgi:hypothetical protein
MGSHDTWRLRKAVESMEHLPVLASMAESSISLVRQADCFAGESDSSMKVAGKK